MLNRVKPIKCPCHQYFTCSRIEHIEHIESTNQTKDLERLHLHFCCSMVRKRLCAKACRKSVAIRALLLMLKKHCSCLLVWGMSKCSCEDKLRSTFLQKINPICPSPQDVAITCDALKATGPPTSRGMGRLTEIDCTCRATLDDFAMLHRRSMSLNVAHSLAKRDRICSELLKSRRWYLGDHKGIWLGVQYPIRSHFRITTLVWSEAALQTHGSHGCKLFFGSWKPLERMSRR